MMVEGGVAQRRCGGVERVVSRGLREEGAVDCGATVFEWMIPMSDGRRRERERKRRPSSLSSLAPLKSLRLSTSVSHSRADGEERGVHERRRKLLIPGIAVDITVTIDT